MTFGYDFDQAIDSATTLQAPGKKKKATAAPTALQMPPAMPGTPTPTKPMGQAPTPATGAALAGNVAPALAASTASPAAPTASPTASPQTTTYRALQGVQSLMTELSSATDPRQKAVLQDKAEREVIKGLTDSGHKVQVKGGQILVDGRPYVLGDGSTTPANGNTGISGYGFPDGRATPPIAGPQSSQTSPAPAPRGTGSTMEDVLTSGLAGSLEAIRAARTEAEKKTIAERAIRALVPQLEGMGIAVEDVKNEKIKVGGQWIDLIEDVSGAALPQFLRLSEASAAPPMRASAAMTGAAGAGGVATTLSTGAPASAAPSWAPSASPYQPGEVPLDDVPDLDYERLFADLNARTPVDDQVEAAVLQLLENPDSLDETTIGRLKAQAKDALSQQAQLQEADLLADGVAMGIDDSRWLASERNALQRDHGRAVVDASRDVEIAAADRRGEDRRSAASLGASYASDQAARRQSAVSTAASASLQAAAARGDRIALREQLAAEASRQGLTVDEMTLRYTTSVMDDLTQRYGIDVSAMIDREQLAQAGREFQEDLLFRFQQLAQQDRQFGANYGLELEGLNQQAERDAFARYQWLYE